MKYEVPKVDSTVGTVVALVGRKVGEVLLGPIDCGGGGRRREGACVITRSPDHRGVELS